MRIIEKTAKQNGAEVNFFTIELESTSDINGDKILSFAKENEIDLSFTKLLTALNGGIDLKIRASAVKMTPEQRKERSAKARKEFVAKATENFINNRKLDPAMAALLAEDAASLGSL